MIDPFILLSFVDDPTLQKTNAENYIDDNISDYKILLGSENRDMTDVELLNRDYYQGRFASKDKDGNYIFNWEEQNVH